MLTLCILMSVDIAYLHVPITFMKLNLELNQLKVLNINSKRRIKLYLNKWLSLIKIEM